jgi:hypothetical protein
MPDSIYDEDEETLKRAAAEQGTCGCPGCSVKGILERRRLLLADVEAAVNAKAREMVAAIVSAELVEAAKGRHA